MKLAFYTPVHGVKTDSFGAATFGFVGAEDAAADSLREIPWDIEGDLYCGSYHDILEQLPSKDWQAGIVLLGNAGNENEFIHELSSRVNCPLTGGGAAIDPVSGRSGLLFGGGQAAVFLIRDKRYDVQVYSENIHRNILGEHRLTLQSPRILRAIDGRPAAQWLREKKASLGLDESDFERLTFSDKNGINAHLSLVNGDVLSGRDLQEHMLLRYLPPEQTFPRIRAFYDDANAIIFGCAGLKGILPSALGTAGMGLFMFGEVCTMGQEIDFGNLMLSKIRITLRAGDR